MKQRATKQEDVSEQWGQPAWIYTDGSVRGERGKMLKALAGRVPFTQSRARELAPLAIAARVEHKRERAIAGANKALEKLGDWDRPTGLDFVEAITEAQTVQALLGSEAYRTQAAKFVMDATGQGEQKQERLADAAVTWRGLLELALRLQPPDAVDAEVTEAE